MCLFLCASACDDAQQVETVRDMSHINDSRRTYQWVVSYISRVMSHSLMGHVPHISEQQTKTVRDM